MPHSRRVTIDSHRYNAGTAVTCADTVRTGVVQPVPDMDVLRRSSWSSCSSIGETAVLPWTSYGVCSLTSARTGQDPRDYTIPHDSRSSRWLGIPQHPPLNLRLFIRHKLPEVSSTACILSVVVQGQSRHRQRSLARAQSLGCLLQGRAPRPWSRM